MKKMLLAAAAAVTVLVAITSAMTWADKIKKEIVGLTPEQVRWFKPPYYKDGRQRAQLFGDSSQGGVWIDRVKIPDGMHVLAHTHPQDELVTVIEGTWYLGEGERFDSAKLKGYPAGSFIVIPAGVAHDAVAGPEGAVVIANQARAAILLPLGSKTRMMIAVSDLHGKLLGLFRMADATIFSIDVSVAKARNVVFLSGLSRLPSDLPGVPMGTAVTSRTISFGAQPLFPPGIDGSSPGPFFQLFLNDVATPCRQGSQPPNANQSGIVFFPGSVPLFQNGQMVGGLGVSGDGVEQDDLVTAGGATGFAPPPDIRADRVEIDKVRLPFFKFPRNPFE